MTRALSLSLILGAIALSACSQPATEDTTPAAETPAAVEDSVTVADAFIVKPAAGRDIAGAGLVLSVTGEPRTLVGAASSIADTVELHTMSMDEGVMRMRKVEAFEITAETPLILERGGSHLMLFGIPEDLEVGATVDLALTLVDSAGHEEVITADASVIGLGD